MLSFGAAETLDIVEGVGGVLLLVLISLKSFDSIYYATKTLEVGTRYELAVPRAALKSGVRLARKAATASLCSGEA